MSHDLTEDEKADIIDGLHPRCETCDERGCRPGCGCCFFEALVVPPSEQGYRTPALVHEGECLDTYEAGGLVAAEVRSGMIVPEPYDRDGTPGLACLRCNSAWPASEPTADYHHAAGCTEVRR